MSARWFWQRAKAKKPWKGTPSDTGYEYAFPFSTYSGRVDPATPVLQVREQMRTAKIVHRSLAPPVLPEETR